MQLKFWTPKLGFVTTMLCYVLNIQKNIFFRPNLLQEKNLQLEKKNFIADKELTQKRTTRS